jgi:hypothetical protein
LGSPAIVFTALDERRGACPHMSRLRAPISRFRSGPSRLVVGGPRMRRSSWCRRRAHSAARGRRGVNDEHGRGHGSLRPR